MGASGAIQEQTMEEILASIHRMIVDGDDRPARRRSGAAAESAPVRAVDDDFATAARSFREAEASPYADARDARYDDGGAGHAAEPMSRRFVEDVPPSYAEAANRATTRPVLSSGETESYVGDALSALSQVVMARNPRTVEDLMVEMLRPMLRSWIDANLPTIVERLVQQEIDRISSVRR